MKVKLIIISIILLLVIVFACGCTPIMEKLGLVSPADEEQLSPEKAGPPDGLVKVLIGFKEKPGAAQQAMVKGVGGKIKYTYHIVDAIAASIPEKAIEALQKNPNVRYVEPDGQVFALVQTLPWGVDRIDAEVVHTNALGNKGAGIEIAVIDTGIDYNHLDLVDNYAGGYDFVNLDEDPMDDEGHGTHVAGTIAAKDNDFGVVGVAPDAKLYALKVLDERGRGYFSDVIAALQWCVEKGIQVTNNSYGSSRDPDYRDPAKSLEEAFNNASGILHVAAAGNRGAVIFPAAYLSVIAVSATDSADNLASFSSVGLEVELAAPGVDIYSTYKGGGYATYSGTSMASPHVAGVAALVIASGITDVSEVRNELTVTAEEIGLPDTEQGDGLVDAEKAVLGTTDGDNLPSPATGTISGTVTDIDTEGPIEGGNVTANGYSTTTLSDGSYVLSDLSVGFYTVTASATGYIEELPQQVEVFKDQTTSVDFALTPAQMPSNTMDVSIVMSFFKIAGINVNAMATVTIVDDNIEPNPVEGATVSGQWSRATTDTDSGVTDANGKISLLSDKVKIPKGETATFTFTVNDVTKEGYPSLTGEVASGFIAFPK